VIWFRLKAKHLRWYVVPLLSLYEVDKGELPVWIGRRLDKHVVRVLLLRIDDTFHERPYERDARPLDGI
jgi:hypothetical protein